MKTLMELVGTSDGVIKLQNVLPFLSDSTLVDTFKDQICDALDTYEQNAAAKKEVCAKSKCV